MFDVMSAWLIAVVMGALFFFKPGVAIFANALVLCLSLAHINALLVVVIAALTLFFCGCNQDVYKRQPVCDGGHGRHLLCLRPGHG